MNSSTAGKSYSIVRGPTIIGNLGAMARDWKRMRDYLQRIETLGTVGPDISTLLRTLECKEQA